ncbi:ATP-binding cassette transporter [Coprinopsis sp. MPI-PUGE-AT-0042]|nr:ATP-binding cassette transporter [Coprinopsis sp. MPI-PUGE-AT-0042]
MLPYQLEVSTLLASGAAASATALVWNTVQQNNKIQLPVNADDSFTRDPFDIVTPEDVVDGFPIDEEQFWARIRRRKGAMVILLALSQILSAIITAFKFQGNNNTKEQVVACLQLAFSVYLLGISAYPFVVSGRKLHNIFVWHIAILATIAALALCLVSVVPRAPVVGTGPGIHGFLRDSWYALSGIYGIVGALAFTTPSGPPLHFPPENIYADDTVKAISNANPDNVCGVTGASPWATLLFSYTNAVVSLANKAQSLEIGDLPILPGNMRATYHYSLMRVAMRRKNGGIFGRFSKPGSGWNLFHKLLHVNILALSGVSALCVLSSLAYYGPAFFLRKLVAYLEGDPDRINPGWGWVYVIALLCSTWFTNLVAITVFSTATATIQIRLRNQLNAVIFAKTLVRKDMASTAESDSQGDKASLKEEFSSKTQVMNLMTTDTDRVSSFATNLVQLIGFPIELLVGNILIYNLLGVSSLVGVGVMLVFLPLNHLTMKTFMGVQGNLMKARDERMSLMNEILGAIRMIKFMAWERQMESKVMEVRNKELKFQQRHYCIWSLWIIIWHLAPALVTLASFWHFTVVRQQKLTPSIAFTSILIFQEMKFALNMLPDVLINFLQTFVSLRRIETYLNGDEVQPVQSTRDQPAKIALESCTISWPQNGPLEPDTTPPSRPRFTLADLELSFPIGELSLICGKIGSGKTLLLHALLGEADVLGGRILCPRSPPDSLPLSSKDKVSKEDWIVAGRCAYVPQSAWLRNASIKDNILFNLPMDSERYQQALEACALLNDLDMLEDGDQTEIGERGVNLSGGQKARVSLARAVYSRASTIFLDDVLSAVDAHTAHHLYHNCLKGNLMMGRSLILVSHHVQLCASGAAYVVALDNGQLEFAGDSAAFRASGVSRRLGQSDGSASVAGQSEGSSQTATLDTAEEETKAGAPSGKEEKVARKFVEEETREVGHIKRGVWSLLVKSCGGYLYWTFLAILFVLAPISVILESAWIKHWTAETLEGELKEPLFYIGVYAAINGATALVGTSRWVVTYIGSIHASRVLYERLLDAILYADVRFRDTVSRGRLLNRFGKDFEGIDSSLMETFGKALSFALSALTIIGTIASVGGAPSVVAILMLSIPYFMVAKIYGQAARDTRRLESISRSPLYAIYGEVISGVPVLRAFGASSKFLRDMLRFVDTNASPNFWQMSVNRWVSIRVQLLSAVVVAAVGALSVMRPAISASLAGFALAVASDLSTQLLWMVRQFVGLEQSMVALERVKEYSEVKREAAEVVEPRPSATWPLRGEIKVEDLCIRYAPDLPDVLHDLSFTIRPGEKVGIVGRTGSGKSTLALSFFRFVEATCGRILVDEVDIAKIGLLDLRSRLTIIPQDPAIISGTVRSTLDILNEYEDSEIYEALRRVHLIPSADGDASPIQEQGNANAFRNLDSLVSEAGENFSAGEKQLLCMARALLKRSKILLMDEATASVDYATDELIATTIRKEFAGSTILTIAHRIRSVIEYDRVVVLDQGRIVEFDSPKTLLSNENSNFHALCRATGEEEFASLRRMAGLSL